MLSLFNSSERTLLAWRNLFALADPRFVLADIRRPEGSTMSVIEAVWIG